MKDFIEKQFSTRRKKEVGKSLWKFEKKVVPLAGKSVIMLKNWIPSNFSNGFQ